MAHLIDKDALVAEIERRIASLESFGSENYLHDNCPEQYAMLVTLKSLIFSIDTLEVKEVDLEKETSFQWSKFCLSSKDKGSFVKVAEHFFELGIKAQKGE